MVKTVTAFLALSTTLSAAPTFTSTPREWAVYQGEYEYIPEGTTAGTPPVTFSVLEKPDWLSWDGTRLSGTPPTEDEGLDPLVIVRATDGDFTQTDQSFNIKIGRLVGPVASAPGGGSMTWVTGMPQVARGGGDAMLLTGFLRSDEFPIFWGLQPEGFAMAMDYIGPSGATGEDFEVPPEFEYDPAEIGTYQSGSPTDLPGGVAHWMGTTNRPASNGGGAVNTYLRADARDIGNTVSLPAVHGDVFGVDGTVGPLFQIPDAGDMRVILRLHAVGVYPSGTPALDWFNALNPKTVYDRTITSCSSTLYWVNTPPRFTANGGLALDQGNTLVLTTTMINAEDTEDSASDVRFVLGDGVNPLGGIPENGILEKFSDPDWIPLGVDDSFTLQQLQDGHVRYVHDDSYTETDSFTFQIFDAQDTVARDGDFTVFQTSVTISLVNHPPVANNQSEDVPIGGTINGFLDFTDQDIGNIPQSIVVTPLQVPALGSLTVTDPSTGAFTFTSNGNVGSEQILWSVTDGEFADVANLTVTVANQPPVIQPLSLMGTNTGGISGTATVDDPDLPAQDITLQEVTPPSKGSLDINGFELTYTADPGRFGEDSFVLTATDELSGVSEQVTVTVMIRPGSLYPEALFVCGSNNLLEGGQTGVIQRVNPANGDIYTLVTDLGSQVRSLEWLESEGKLLAAVVVGSTPANAILKLDPLTGEFGMEDIVTADGNISFPLGLAMDGPHHCLLANGPGGVIRVEIATGIQEVIDLGLPGGETVVSALPVGPDDIWVASAKDIFTANDGSLFLGNRNTASYTTPVALSPAGDPAGLFLEPGDVLAIARAGIPVELIELDPLSYTSHGVGPTAAWGLPAGLAPFEDNWIIADPFGGGLYAQERGTTVVSTVSVPEVAETPFGLLSVDGTLLLNPVLFYINESDEAVVDFIGIPNRKYRVQRSLDTVTWEDMDVVTAQPDGSVQFIDPSPPSPEVFYRLAD